MPRHQLPVFNFSIQNSSADSVDIHIDGAIVDAETQQFMADYWGDETSVSFKSFRDQVNAINASTLNIYINSPGGHVGDAMAIHDLIVDLQARGKTVNTIGRGIIASAATYILMAGNSSMSANSWFMIHNASGFAYGSVDEVENQARTLRKFNDAIRDFYANATGLKAEEIGNMMTAETWLTATEAKEKGFVKAVSSTVGFTNSIARETWMFKNTTVLNAYNSAVRKPDDAPTSTNIYDQMKKLFNDFATSVTNALKGVKPTENNDQQALLNSIGDTVGNAFQGLGDQMEAAVTEHVTNALKGETVTNAITEAVTKATTELTNRIAALEKTNKELEQEITNLKGTGTGNRKEEEAPTSKVGGTWV